jgi:hypothetical protein
MLRIRFYLTRLLLNSGVSQPYTLMDRVGRFDLRGADLYFTLSVYAPGLFSSKELGASR